MINPTTSSVEPIPLRRIDSLRYTPSEYTTTTNDIASTTASLLSSSNPSNFTPTSSFQIQSPGKSPISLPLPTKDLTIPIFSPTTGRPVYLAIRPIRRSASCFLVDAEDETETSIASTTYWFGPGKNPRVKIGRDDDVAADVFEINGKSLLTRTMCFESRKWGKFEWRYAGKRERSSIEPEAKVNNLLVLEKIARGESGKEERIKVAQLVRSEETRTPGTKASYAGNGGRLEMCLRDEDGRELVHEVTVVMTCLVMLKKEIDRLRGAQIAVMNQGGCFWWWWAWAGMAHASRMGWKEGRE